MEYNLQFFASDEEPEALGAEEQTVAESEETVNPVDETVEASEETQSTEQPVDMNAIYANARRRAEAEAKQKYDNERRSVDDEYVRMFGSYTNPLTGQPIRSAKDYADAFKAEQQMKAKRELEEKGVSDETINRIVENNPVVRQAQKLVAQQEAIRAVENERAIAQQIKNDVAEISKLNPSIKTLNDVPNEVIDKCMQIQGLSLVDAYKMLNYGNFTSEREAAVRQNAINQAKGKQHLQPVNGVSTPESGVDIPEEALNTWKNAYPDLSMAELRKKYNRVFGNK